ncbi:MULTISPECIES: DUF3784 domain-containing protein [Bacillaceae]|uniref:DUF3784 domain-containing protein n=1 Tax=Bacillaceae TaxID=186817 RepID=UPI000E74B5CB|nr:DUF3784 domain-containing protein [Bacillus sp. PK3_68]RJS59216.1 hypothetical protein CJ483_03330 [Bacillus sp. PK3_68]
MDINLIVIGIIFLVLGYLVGVKKMTWLLSGFNEKRVKDKTKLAKIVGRTEVILGCIMILGGLVGVKPPGYLVTFCVLVILGLVVYVNAKMVE